jgi:alpha-1,4-digalacturonate transport system permease protein
VLPMGQKQMKVEGYDKELPAYRVKRPDGSTAELGLLRRIGIEGQFVDPAAPAAGIVRAPMATSAPVREARLAIENYTVPLGTLSFGRYFLNSLFVTITATAITLVINSMCAFALSKYEFRGRNAIFIFILSTLMIPISVILVPAFVVVTSLGLSNSLWGVILPPAATPTGVFLLRQYMLTIPD